MSDEPDVLFAPPDGGDEYKPGDFNRVASQQPLKYDEIPWYLLEEFDPDIAPPKLWAGWRVNNEDVFLIAEEKMTDLIRYTGSGRPSFRLVTDGRFARRVCQLCQIPEEDWELVKLVFVVKPIGTFAPDIVLTCGSTTDGVVGDAERQRMAELVASGREAEWHLDYLLWRWQFGRPSGLPKPEWSINHGAHHPQAEAASTVR